MKIITGYLYHIKDDFFDKLKNYGLMINHENGHSRPSYKRIAGRNQVILIQNAFPTIATYVCDEILDNFKYTLSLKEDGLNLFFTDVDKIMDVINNEIKMGV